MTISFLLPNLRLYGGIRRMLEIANRLIDDGHAVTLYHSNGSPCAWMPVRATVRTAADFVRTNHDHALYIFHEQYPIFHQANAKHRYFYCLNLYDKGNLALPLWFSYFIDRRAYHIRQAVCDPRTIQLVNCTDSQRWLKKNFGVVAIPVLGAVDHTIFHRVDVPRDCKIIRILFLGSPKRWKGTQIILDAVALVRKRHPNIIADHYYDKGILQRDMASVYSAADILVDAQYYAGWNNPVAEAMACKVPVVCNDIGPNRDIAIHEETALLTPVGDAVAMAAAIERILANCTLRERLINNAFQKILPFTWERTARELLGIFNHNNLAS